MRTLYTFIFLITTFVCNPIFSFSQSGILDASFGNGGKVVTAIGDSASAANSIAITANGKIIVGGYERSVATGSDVGNVLQYNSNGTLDTTFGNKGKVLNTFGDQSAISSIAIQPDGKIVAGGYISFSHLQTKSGFLIARYNINGSLDSTFGNNGIVVTSFSSGTGNIKKLVLTPDGKIIAGGTVSEPIFESHPAFAQYLPDGTPDSTFGTNGIVEKDRISFPGGKTDGVNDITLTTAGKIVAVIDEIPMGVNNQTDFLTYQLLPNGNNDSTFGTNGIVQTDMDSISGDNAYSAVVLPDNSIVVTGYSYKYIYYPATNTYYSATSIASVKYRSNGALDSTFGIDGKVLTLTPDSAALGNHILLSTDGQLIISGYTNYPKQDFVVAKYMQNGTIDSSFGNDGIVTTDFLGYDDISFYSVLQPDGKIVVAGKASNGVNDNIALARYTNGVLPLHLLFFTAAKNGSNNLLQWQTAQEINTSGFEIQRSSNGSNYTVIGNVHAGSGVYHFTDKEPLAGSNYYRLKIMDKDGRFNYSAVRIVNNSSSFNVKMYPNPATDKLQVEVSSNKVTVLQVQIVAADGKLVSLNRWTIPAGNTLKEVALAALAKGYYYLIITTTHNEQKVLRFEKL